MATIVWLQSVMQGAFWDTFWLSVSELYAEDWLLALAAALFWVTSRSFARFFASIVILQLWLNAFFKGLFAVARPEGSGVRVQAVDVDGSFSRPSGHAQGSAVVYSALARGVRRWWFTVLAVVAMLLVGLSRLYLGLHWPEDVVLGWLIGLALSLGVAMAWPWLARQVNRIPFGARLVLAVAIPALMAVAWELLPFVARVGLVFQYPALGGLAGLWLGTLLEERYVGFDHRARLSWHVGKVALGVALVMAVRLALKPVLGGEGWLDFVRYIAVGLTVTPLMPWVFAMLARRFAGSAREAPSVPARPVAS